MYSSEEYQLLAIKSISNLERISLERGGNSRINELTETYREATLLEEGFWDDVRKPTYLTTVIRR